MDFYHQIIFLLSLTLLTSNLFTIGSGYKKLSKNSVETFDFYDIKINSLKVLENNDQSNKTFRKKRTLVLPGTLWCGVQNVAVYDEDLGFFSLTDACCRDHKKCSFEEEEKDSGSRPTPRNNVTPFASEQYKGEAICRCERKFYRCLRKANNMISRNLGRLYFNLIQKTCFTFDHPSLHCIKYQGLLRWRCLEYAVNTSAPMVIEKRDNPFFF